MITRETLQTNTMKAQGGVSKRQGGAISKGARIVENRTGKKKKNGKHSKIIKNKKEKNDRSHLWVQMRLVAKQGGDIRGIPGGGENPAETGPGGEEVQT